MRRVILFSPFEKSELFLVFPFSYRNATERWVITLDRARILPPIAPSTSSFIVSNGKFVLDKLGIVSRKYLKILLGLEFLLLYGKKMVV